MMINVRLIRKSQGKFARFSGFVISFWTLLSNCYSAPLLHSKSLWHDNDDLPTIFTSSCDPVTGHCIDWLPIVNSRFGNHAIEQDSKFNSVQLIKTRDVDSDVWRKATPVGAETSNPGNFGNFVNFDNHMATGKLSKKDVFMSRGWGAGGMPFSVLYMSPRINHLSHSGTSEVETRKNVKLVRKNDELTNGQIIQPNYRVALRNGGTNQPRRHYSIIPQLFISYGWGPSGK